MNAVEFVKEYGIQAAQYYTGKFNSLNEFEEKFINLNFRDDLTKIVKAFDMVESYGGLAEASCYVFEETGEDCYYNKPLEEAINLVEQCYE